jgi:hypothetical protein
MMKAMRTYKPTDLRCGDDVASSKGSLSIHRRPLYHERHLDSPLRMLLGTRSIDPGNRWGDHLRKLTARYADLHVLLVGVDLATSVSGKDATATESRKRFHDSRRSEIG